MLARRPLLGLLPLALAACARDAPLPPVRRLEGYAYLTPLRLNVAEVEIVPAPPGPATRVDPPAPLVPAVEVTRMGRDRLSAFGTAGRARFVTEAATLLRAGGRINILMRAQVEILADDRRVAFAVAEVRRTATDGGARAAEVEVVRAMEDLNVEFELQVRRNLRDWLVLDTPAGEAPIQREDLPRS
ncbi:hypothetical protein ACE7GA_05225 [Roseomonas sp. CCTCC AB2023176]|uniref:hypothetical protein n=1 Tax=Roseomonas sp. CCTCC AB2023176 TaxID=3342640 RepID=UPI0035D6412F